MKWVSTDFQTRIRARVLIPVKKRVWDKERMGTSWIRIYGYYSIRVYDIWFQSLLYPILLRAREDEELPGFPSYFRV